jgi:hypothetical protein
VGEPAGRADLGRDGGGRHRRPGRAAAAHAADLTQTVLVLLGITLGSLVSRQLIQHMSAYPLTIGLLAR